MRRTVVIYWKNPNFNLINKQNINCNNNGDLSDDNYDNDDAAPADKYLIMTMMKLMIKKMMIGLLQKIREILWYGSRKIE